MGYLETDISNALNGEEPDDYNSHLAKALLYKVGERERECKLRLNFSVFFTCGVFSVVLHLRGRGQAELS